jgi:predicted ATPase/DNA-binding CsgD family transcriptional regulator
VDSPDSTGVGDRHIRVLEGRERLAGPRHNLPHVPSSFVGRRREVAEVNSVLSRSRLVTLTGAGGMGKTRIALQVADGALSHYDGGVWLAELAPVVDPDLLPEALAAVLPGRRTRPGVRSADHVVTQIGEQSLLLVLDNCEHLVDACADLVDELLRSCPGLVVLATSREPLGIGGEHTRWIGPLSLPDPAGVDAASVMASDAGELFVERATATSPRFELTDEEAPAVAAVCRRLDGMPLAIELAAARLTTLSVGDVLERLDDRFRLLTSGSRAVMPRHQRLVATLEWSHDLLLPAEATLLRRVAVFAGWRLSAAEKVCAGDGINRTEVVDHLTGLVNKSLVVSETRPDGLRFCLLDSIRAWAQEKLEASPEATAVRRRHASWCLRLAERAETELRSGHHQPWLSRLEAEYDNIRSALEWARASGDVELGPRLATALVDFWRLRHAREGLRWLEWAVEATEDGPLPLRARALRGNGMLLGMLGDIGSAIPLLDESSALFTEVGDADASVCTCHPLFLMFRDPRQSLAVLDEKIAGCRLTGEMGKLTYLLGTLGQAHYMLGEAADARQRFEEAVEVARQVADDEALCFGLFGLARVAIFVGDRAGAEASVTEARACAEKMDDPDSLGFVLGLRGDLARSAGDWDRARELLDESERVTRSAGDSLLSLARTALFSARLAEFESYEGGGKVAGDLYQEALELGHSADAPRYHEIRCLLGLGSAAQAEGDLGDAAGRFLEALEMARATGDTPGEAQALDCLSGMARLHGEVDEATRLGCCALQLRQELGERPALASSLETVGGAVIAGERWVLGCELLGAAQAFREAEGYARSRLEDAVHERDVEEARTALGAEAFTSAWARGYAMPFEDAVEYAVRGGDARRRPVTGWDSFTPAEREVVRLVGHGLTNPEVARRLHVSPRTVGHHLAHVYQKLGIHSRGALIKEAAGREE